MFGKRFWISYGITTALMLVCDSPLKEVFSSLDGTLSYWLRFGVYTAVFIIVGFVLPRKKQEKE